MLADLFYQDDNSSDIHIQLDNDPQVSNKVHILFIYPFDWFNIVYLFVRMSKSRLGLEVMSASLDWKISKRFYSSISVIFLIAIL